MIDKPKIPAPGDTVLECEDSQRRVRIGDLIMTDGKLMAWRSEGISEHAYWPLRIRPRVALALAACEGINDAALTPGRLHDSLLVRSFLNHEKEDLRRDLEAANARVAHLEAENRQLREENERLMFPPPNPELTPEAVRIRPNGKNVHGEKTWTGIISCRTCGMVNYHGIVEPWRCTNCHRQDVDWIDTVPYQELIGPDWGKEPKLTPDPETPTLPKALNALLARLESMDCAIELLRHRLPDAKERERLALLQAAATMSIETTGTDATLKAAVGEARVILAAIHEVDKHD